jgi:Domain of unknown function (DUF4279)
MKEYLSTAYVYFTFFGEGLAPLEFTNLLKIEPTKQGNKGDRGEYGSILRESFWEYRCKETNALEDLENSIHNLFELFETKHALIQSYCELNKIQSKCFVVLKSKSNEDTGVVFNISSIRILSSLNMELEICNYIEDESDRNRLF